VRLAFLAGGAVTDRRAWSGTIHYAHRALSKRFDVVPVEMPMVSKTLRGLRKIGRRIGTDPLREPFCSDLIGAHAERMVKQTGADAAFVLGASHIAAGLAARLPVFHCSDATFGTMVGYHGEFVNLSKRTVWAGNELEGRAITRSAAAILASEWAAHSARTRYGRPDVHVVPFGANLDELPSEDVWQQRPVRSLVFVGVNWYEKGADIAVEATRLLNEQGLPVVLHIVGCSPPDDFQPTRFVKCHGFLRKQNRDEYARLTALVASADFLIVPTRFEAFGIVFCEAAAHGTPSIARHTGGVPTIIDDGVTGALLPVDAEAQSYAERIRQLLSDPIGYREMRRNAFLKARRILNWDAWGASVESIVGQALTRPVNPIVPARG
jgi:glycosyltransferase involved in cell wall biosynthesis